MVKTVAKGTVDLKDVPSLKFAFETLNEQLRADPRFLDVNFSKDVTSPRSSHGVATAGHGGERLACP